MRCLSVLVCLQTAAVGCTRKSKSQPPAVEVPGSSIATPNTNVALNPSGTPGASFSPISSVVPTVAMTPFPTVLEQEEPFYALLIAKEAKTNLTSQSVTKTGFAPVYRLELDLKAGDLVKLRGQIEVTNDAAMPVGVMARLTANGTVFGSVSQQNVLKDGSHHMPLWSDGIYSATRDEKVVFEAQVSTYASASFGVKVETDTYGHLVAEQFRRFATRKDALVASASYLVEAKFEKNTSETQFGTTSFVKAYRLKFNQQKDDMVRLYGSATAGFVKALQMHGQVISRESDGAILSPAASQNVRDFDPFVPLWTDALYSAQSSGEESYAVRLSGAFGTAATVLADGGQLIGLLFRRLTDSTQQGYVLAELKEHKSTLGNTTLVSNAGFKDLMEIPVSIADRDILRVVAYTHISHPTLFPQGVACKTKLVVRDSKLNEQNSSVVSARYTFPDLETATFRNEWLLSGTEYKDANTVVLLAGCSREGAQPSAKVVEGRTWIFTEKFTSRAFR